MFPKLTSRAPTENISNGINKGNVITLVIARRLLLEFAMEAVIDEINTRLKRDKEANTFICQKNLKSSERVRNISGEVMKKNTTKFK